MFLNDPPLTLYSICKDESSPTDMLKFVIKLCFVNICICLQLIGINFFSFSLQRISFSSI